jgi:hypothetical protein
MARYVLGAEITVSAYTIVEAETEKQAIEIAEERGVEIGGIGSRGQRDEDWIVDEIDGEPMNIEVTGED